MKKLLIFPLLILFSVCTFAQSTQNKVEKPKLKFKHSAGPAHCMNCSCPLGICIQINFKMGALTQNEINDGYGTVTATIVEGKLNVVFENPAALEDGTIHFDEDMIVTPEFARSLGLSSLTVKAGIYNVDFSRYTEFGEIFLTITTN